MRKNELILNNIFGRSLFEPLLSDMGFNGILPSMRTDIKETNTEYTVMVDVPGVPKEKININLEDGYLKISTETEKEEKNDAENWIRRERYSASQSQEIYIGNVKEENIKASMKDGVLTIIIPKEEKAPVGKTINIE